MITNHSVRRFLALIICVLMVVSLFPISALSEGDGAAENESVPIPENAETEFRELETLELEIPGAPVYPTLWLRAVDRNGSPVENVLLELILPSGGRASEFRTDANGLASCDLGTAGDSTVAYIRCHPDDRSGYGPASDVAVSLDRGSLVSVQGQTAGFEAGNPYMMTVYPTSYIVRLNPNGGSFYGYDSFEVLAEKYDAAEPFGYLPTDRFETYLPSEAFVGQTYTNPVLEGYAVTGWYTAPDGGEQIFFDQSGNGTRLYSPVTTIYAHWAAIDYTIFIDSSISHGMVTASSSVANIRNTVTLFVAPESVRYELASLSVRAGDSELPLTAAGDGAYSFTMPANDVTVSASFREITVDSTGSVAWEDEANRDSIRPSEVTLTLLADGEPLKSTVVTADGNWTCTESGLPKYSEAGAEISYTWTEQPLRGYEIHAETANGVTTLTNTLMPKYSVAVTAEGSGSVLVKMGEAEISSAYAGDSVTLTVMPGEGYEPDTLTVKQGETDVDVTKSEDGSYAFLMPAGDITVSAVFKAIHYSVTVQTSENGAVAADRTDAVFGETVTLTLTPDLGYEQEALTVKQGDADVDVIKEEDGSSTFTMPAGNVDVSAAFKAIDYTVTVHEAENGTVVADKATATVGQTVTLTVTPEIGYAPDSLSVKDSDNMDVAVAENAFTMPAKNVEVSASFKEITPVFMTHSLILGGELGINFFMDLPEFEGADYSDSYMTFSVNGETLRDSFDESDTDLSGNGYYGFTCTVNSLQMADEINAVYHYKTAGEEKTVSQVYTVEAYLNALLESDGVSEEVKALARSLADYGYYSQSFLSEIGIGANHNEMTTRFTNTYSAEQIAGILNALADQGVQRTSNRNIEQITYSLYLDSKTSIYLYLKSAADYSGEICAALDGSPVTVVKENDGRCRITIPELSANQLDDMHQVVISTDGADPLTVQVSALSYVKTCLEDENSSDRMIDAMAALYYYYAAASSVKQAS